MHRHLAGVVTAAMGLVLIVFLAPLLLLVYRDAEHQAVASATEQAVALAAAGPTLASRQLPDVPVAGFATSVFLPDGRVIGVPSARTPSVQAATGCVPSTERTEGGVEVLVPVRTAQGCPTVVRVLASEEALAGDTAKITALVLVLSAALLLLGLLLAERLARNLLRSVRDLAAVADRMAAGDLNARATPNGPSEIRRVGAQLNRLAIRVDHLLDEQRQRAADLAHRLRTPLTSLRLNIEALPDGEEARRLLHDHEAVTRALDEVIRTARRAVTEGPGQLADLAKVVRERVAFWSVLAEDTGRTISCELADAPMLVRAGPTALAAALDALLGNVFAHTPDGVSIQVTARPVNRDVLLTVDDAGPGFPNLEVIQRGKSTGSSTGLGLDIARRTAQDSGGWLRLGCSPLGGARVELLLGGHQSDAQPRRSYPRLNR